jgi:predicted dehydrogenase
LGNAAREVLSLTKPVDVYFEGSAERSLDALLARSDIDGVVIAVPITKQPDLIRRGLS